MHVFKFLCAVALPAVVSAFPNAPFVTEGQWVHDSTGENFTYVGVNWPGAGEVMIPEGLQYQSVASIASKIKSLGMNSVRLTFAIELIDDIKDNGGDVTIQNAFKKALGNANGATVYNQVIKNNPQFGASTTRLQVYSTSHTQGRAISDNMYRSTTTLLLSSQSKKFMFTLTTTCRTEHGAAPPTTATHGLVTNTLMLRSGSEALATWPHM
jgi:hypothetical protein